VTNNIVLRSRTLLDGTGRDPIDDGAIVIASGRISSAGRLKDTEVPADSTLVDMGDCVLMPGIIDAHLHLAAPNSADYKTTDIAHVIRSPAEMLLDAVKHARICLEAGITTVRDLDWISPTGNFCAELVCLREAIAAGKVPGPRMVVGGFTHTSNSHFDKIIPRNTPRVPDVVADGPWALRRLARLNLRAGADLIKTCVSGGSSTFDPYEDYFDIHLSLEELTAICDEAHNYRRLVSAHCHTPDSVRMALAAGVDTIEHCVFTDDEVPELLAKSGKYCIPTLLVREKRVVEARRSRGVPEVLLRKRQAMADQCFDTFRRYHKAGVKFAMGTDTCVDPAFGESAREVGIYVELGMAPMDAILTATRNAAETIGLGSSLGVLEPGRIADVIAVDGDPIENIWVLAERDKIKMVMKEGSIFVDRRFSNTEAVRVH
jgi:imidazolonepropionase-like amidohydrolase